MKLAQAEERHSTDLQPHKKKAKYYDINPY